jgi:hypothetical protein
MCAAGPFGVPGGRLMFVLFDQGTAPPPLHPPMYAPALGPVDAAPDEEVGRCGTKSGAATDGSDRTPSPAAPERAHQTRPR